MGTKCAPIQHKNVIYSLLQNFYIEVITCVRLARELPFAMLIVLRNVIMFFTVVIFALMANSSEGRTLTYVSPWNVFIGNLLFGPKPLREGNSIGQICYEE
jgi:hypothetical protein